MKAAVIGPKITQKWSKIHLTIKNILKENNITVDFSYFKTSTSQDAADLEKTYKKNQTLLRVNDFVIAETTDYSGGIGYLVAQALASRTPVLALYNKEVGDKPSNVIKSSSLSKRLEFKEYTIEELPLIIKHYIKTVRPLLDTKYILNLPSQLDRFLEYCSFKRGIPKSHIVREAIEEMMKTDQDWISTENK